MPLSHEHVGSQQIEEIKIYSLTRAELLCSLCYEIPCSSNIVRRPQNLNQSSTVFDITLMQSAKLIQDFAASSEYLNSDI